MDNFLRFEYILINFYIKDIFNNDLNPIEFNNICNKFNATFLTRIYTNNIPEDIHMYFKLKNILIINRSNEILYYLAVKPPRFSLVDVRRSESA